MEMKKMVRDLPWVLIGNFMLALAVAMFILPYNILSGGVAGIAVALQPVFHIEPTLMVNALVLGMFVLGTLFLGKSFAVKTVISSLVYPVYLTIITPFVPLLQLDPILASLYGGLLAGVCLLYTSSPRCGSAVSSGADQPFCFQIASIRKSPVPRPSAALIK